MVNTYLFARLDRDTSVLISGVTKPGFKLRTGSAKGPICPKMCELVGNLVGEMGALEAANWLFLDQPMRAIISTPLSVKCHSVALGPEAWH